MKQNLQIKKFITMKTNDFQHLGKGIYGKITTITPEMAEKMLKNNYNNRKKKIGKISQYAVDMREGKWKMNGDPIRFAETNRLLDGQNRLFAIVESGVSQDMLVLKGFDENVFATIDTGANRNAADVLSTFIENPSRATDYSSLIRRIISYERGIRSLGTPKVANTLRRTVSRITITNEDVVDYLINKPYEINDVYEFCTKLRKKSKTILAYSDFQFIFWMLRAVNMFSAIEFCTNLATGVALEEGNPILVLRERLLKNKQQKVGGLSAKELLQIISIAWNYYRLGNKITQLRIMPNSKVPKLI